MTGKGYKGRQGSPGPSTSSPSPLSLQGPYRQHHPCLLCLLATVVPWPALPMWSSSGRWSGTALGYPLPIWTPASSGPVFSEGWSRLAGSPCSPQLALTQTKAAAGQSLTAELGALSRDQLHGDSSVFGLSSRPGALCPQPRWSCFPYLSPLDLPSLVIPESNLRVTLTSPIPGLPPELGCRLYLHLPRQQQEEVERLLEVSGELANGWRGLAGRLGYQAEAVETMA